MNKKKESSKLSPELRKMIRKAKKFYSKPENQKALRKKIELAIKSAKDLAEGRKVPIEMLRVPYGPVGGKWPHQR